MVFSISIDTLPKVFKAKIQMCALTVETHHRFTDKNEVISYDHSVKIMDGYDPVYLVFF